jgi:hypothetical protein
MKTIMDVIRRIRGLENTKLTNCCRFIESCEDSLRYLALRDNVEEDDKEYEHLVDQIREVCTNKVSLENEALICSTRNTYLSGLN